MAKPMSKAEYLKRYMSKEDRQDYKMKRRVISDIEQRKKEEQGLTTSRNPQSGLEKFGQSSLKSGKSHMKRRHDSDSDTSPSRKKPPGSASRSNHSDSDQSPLRITPSSAATSRARHDSESDQSPPRKTSSGPSRKRLDSDSDQSPPRKMSTLVPSQDTDQSPPRRTKMADSDSDQSPPRQKTATTPSSSKGRDRPSRFSAPSPPPSKKSSNSAKATKTLSGATAGLSSAADMKREAKRIREKEDKSFHQIDEDILGRHASTVLRDKETGRRRNMQAEMEQEEEEDRKKELQKQKYEQWGKGLSQQQERDQRLADQVHEASKPLARYNDDKDLDDMLKQEERAEDPMLAFIRKKKNKEDAKGGAGIKPKKELPKYKGRAPPPPNRYNLMPGYRWDGVDRSNGFENKLFANINNKKAVQEMAYKWSTEDM